ncbi:MAG: glycoside hydrolase family 43 protein, partial [Bacteroidetes bacterium]
EGEIWLQEIDLDNWALKGERHFLWRGACGGVWVEGPHIYKRDGRYYLMVAEGGTSFNHAVMIAVSDQITGPYIPNERNPILTTRNLSYDNWVVSTGHADLIELEDGRWFMVALGVRGDENRGSNMGRETHLIPVQWEREPFEWKKVKYEWPVCAPSTGKVERFNPLPFQNAPQFRNTVFSDNFDATDLNLEWNFRRVPLAKTYSLSANPGHLRLYAKPEIIKERGRCSLMGFRQKESDFEYTASMKFSPADNGSEAGISLFQKDNNYIHFTVIKKDGKSHLQLTLAIPGAAPQIVKSKEISGYNHKIMFEVNSQNQIYQFSYSLDNGKKLIPFESIESTHILSKKYTGAYLGFYCSGNGQETGDFADFDWVNCEFYERLER